MSKTCSDYPYNITDSKTFNNYITNINYINNTDPSNNVIDFSLWNKCITTQKNVAHVDLNLGSINTLLNTYNIDEQIRSDTANESNNYSMTLFQNDIYYTYAKIVFFIILICSYIYFFRVNGIIQPIMNLFNFVKTKIIVDLPKTADKILAKKIPGQKAPAKTNALKTNALPTNSGKTNSAKTNSMK